MMNGKKLKKKCINCNEDFFTFPNNHDRKIKFCSRKCYLDVHSKGFPDYILKKMSKSAKKNLNTDIEYLQKIKQSLGKIANERKGKTYEEIYGEEQSAIEKIKRSNTHKKRWQGKPRKYDLRPYQGGTWEYIEWRKTVFERDNYTCQKCKVRGGQLEGHHILSWANYPSKRFIINNGITLCKSCHKELHLTIFKNKKEVKNG